MSDPPLILVVDDEQSYRDALSIALQREGFLVETAADDRKRRRQAGGQPAILKGGDPAKAIAVQFSLSGSIGSESNWHAPCSTLICGAASERQQAIGEHFLLVS